MEEGLGAGRGNLETWLPRCKRSLTNLTLFLTVLCGEGDVARSGGKDPQAGGVAQAGFWSQSCVSELLLLFP